MPDRRLIGAEILKLRRRRGMIAVCAFLTVGAVLLYYAILVVLHATNAAKHGAAGGLGPFDDTMGVLAMLAGVTGAIVGATAGGADIEAGVFRDLAATGRSRTALFAARLPGALAIVVPLLAAAVLLPALLAVTLAGGEPMTAQELWQGSVQVLSAGILITAVSVGLAATFGARGMVMGVVLAVYLGIAPLLAQVEAIGQARNLIPQVATARLGGADVDDLALGTAIGVVLAWIIVPTLLGAWRTNTQEI